MKNEKLSLNKIQLNDNNPRTIREKRFEQLKDSLLDFPEMMTLRPAVVDESGVILGGNMRTRAKKALLALGDFEKEELMTRAMLKRSESLGEAYDRAAHAQLLTELLFSERIEVTRALGLSAEQKKEFIIKDNGGFGEWDFDALANEDWPDAANLNAWGIDLPPDWAPPSEELGGFIETTISAPLETKHTCPSCGYAY